MALVLGAALTSPPGPRLPGEGRFEIVGRRAPDFSLAFRDGRWRLSDHLGKPIVISFWTTWCGVCGRDLDVLEGLWRRAGGEIEVVGICPEDWSQVPAVLASHPVSFPILPDPGARVTRLYERLPNLRYPFTVFVDSRGTVAGVWAVALRSEAELKALLFRAGIALSDGAP